MIIKIFSAGRPWVISFIILKVFLLSFKNILAQATPLRGVLDPKVAKRKSPSLTRPLARDRMALIQVNGVWLGEWERKVWV